ncbi:MAG: NAD(P)-binding domain-containing protein [Bosea sp. (in: a-proteobacteria)]
MTKTIAIIGAGPVGLAAGAHAIERGMTPIIIEQGPDIGHAVRQWAHVPMFSNWAYDIDSAAGRLLETTGWNRPDPEAYPTGADLLSQYLEPLAKRTALKDAIHLNSTVRSVARRGVDKVKSAGQADAPFELVVRNGTGEKRITADAVIDASGTWFAPNPGGSGGIAAAGETEAAARIHHGMPDVLGKDRARYAGRSIAVLGGGHSAIGTLIELAKLAEIERHTRVIWLYRGSAIAKAFGGGAADQLSARGALGTTIARLIREERIAVKTGFHLSGVELTDDDFVLRSGSGCGCAKVAVDELIIATGFRPDLSFLRELRIALDPALECPPVLAPLIDPNLHSCGTVRPHGAAELSHPEPGFYIAGMKSYGRAPTFLLATGHEQVRSIVAEIAGDHAAARRVELVLPETGVCAGPGPKVAGSAGADAGCCGGTAKQDASACCVADEVAKMAGEAGCGCGASDPVPPSVPKATCCTPSRENDHAFAR